jgi:hypothetical protein
MGAKLLACLGRPHVSVRHSQELFFLTSCRPTYRLGAHPVCYAVTIRVTGCPTWSINGNHIKINPLMPSGNNMYHIL